MAQNRQSRVNTRDQRSWNEQSGRYNDQGRSQSRYYDEERLRSQQELYPRWQEPWTNVEEPTGRGYTESNYDQRDNYSIRGSQRQQFGSNQPVQQNDRYFDRRRENFPEESSRYSPYSERSRSMYGTDYNQGQYGSQAVRNDYNTGFGNDYGQGRYGSQGSDTSNWGSNSMGVGRQGSLYGTHKGKGPKGYTRSDDRIKEDISDRLSDDMHIDASEIEVGVRDGVVSLTGSVESREVKHRAEDLVESISGVCDIENKLRVNHDNGTDNKSDKEINTYKGTSGAQDSDPKNKRTAMSGANS